MPKSSRRTFLLCLGALSALGTVRGGSTQISYVANEVDEHEGLPRGTVDVYAGRSLVQRQPLSLSATHPRHVAVSPGGRFLVVAAYGGGVYNVLPIQADGTLGQVSGIFKELGSGPDPMQQRSAHPHSLVFDPMGGFLLSSDFGCDRLSVFTLSANGKLARHSRLQLMPGSGPGAISLNAAGSALHVQHELLGTLGRYRFDAARGIISAADSLAG